MSWGARIIGMGSVLDLLDDIQLRFDDDVVYVVGTNVEYGIYLETGTSKMQPYPWFKPAIEEYQRDPQKFIAKNAEKSLSELDTMAGIVKVVAFSLERQMKKNVAADKASGRSPGTHPEHPQVDLGNLRPSIRAERVR